MFMRMTTQISKDTYDKLKYLSFKQKLSIAEITRRAIEKYIKNVAKKNLVG